MTRLFWMLMGIGIGAGIAYYSSQNYLVRGAGGYEFVPRSATGFTDAYIDTRQFTPTDWYSHQELVADIAKSGKSHLFQVGQTLQNTFAPTSTPAPAQRAW